MFIKCEFFFRVFFVFFVVVAGCVFMCEPQGQSKESGGQIAAAWLALLRNRVSLPSVPGCVHVYLSRRVSEGGGGR